MLTISSLDSVTQGVQHTCSPVSRFLANLTFPILPAPIVLPNVHCPVCALIVVRLLVDAPLPGWVSDGNFVPPELGPVEEPPLATATAAAVADMCELLREWPGLVEEWRASRVDSGRFDGGTAYERSRDELRWDDEGRATLLVS